MHNESPLQTCRAEPGSAVEKQPGRARLYGGETQGIEQRRRRARRTAVVVGAIAVLVYATFILSGVIGR
ncbi:TPA: hypothetical protein QEL11_003627 [Stenotrophomonas maltophilia]|nr:hypothetical protein [Stenotrophomonas maltophilia]